MKVYNEKIKSWATEIESEAMSQLENMSRLPFVYKHIAVMPDVHCGKGSTIGSVIATKGAIIPAAIGVDIGCGMQAVKLPVKMDAFGDNLKTLRDSIERSVPVGFNQHKESTERIVTSFKNLFVQPEIKLERLNRDLEYKAIHQLGTLGGGNHFIELCADEENNAWVMLHSGSRGLGNILATQHIEKAKGLMKRYFIGLPDPDLAYFAQGTPEFESYITDLLFAQGYAKANRKEMMERILKDISYFLYGEDKGSDYFTVFKVDCHHNYCQMENHFSSNVWVTRKGAVSAKDGEFGIIPGSMGTKSFIVRGKGEKLSFNSCSHGAGRKMSRTKARSVFTLEDLQQQTNGVECRKDKDVIDEIPGAYKNIDEVMDNQKNLVDTVYVLKQVICIKG